MYGLAGRLEESTVHLNREFGVLFDEMLGARVERLAVEPEDLAALVEAITIYHMVLELSLFGVSVNETRAFALKALERRMKGIGLSGCGRRGEPRRRARGG